MTEELELIDEDNTEEFDPTEDDIIEYAAYLGLSPRSDQKYFYIAVEGLKAKLPQPWKPARAKDGSIYYYNPISKIIQEEHPLDEFYRNKVIQAKKADQKGNSGKQKKKLHNLIQQSRDIIEDVQEPKYLRNFEPIINQSFALKNSSRLSSQRNQASNIDTLKQTEDNMLIQRSKSKLSGNLASRLGASSNDQESLLYGYSDKRIDEKEQINFQQEIENYKKIKQRELDNFLQKLQVEIISEQNRQQDLVVQDYESINMKMKESGLRTNQQKQQIKERLYEESEKQYQYEISQIENQILGQRQQLEVQLQEENQRLIQEQINQSLLILSKQKNKIEQLKKQLKTKQYNKERQLLVNRKSLENRFEIQKKFIDENTEKELRYFQDQLEKNYENEKQNIEKQLKHNYNYEKQQIEFNAQIDDSIKIKQKIRDFYREKFLLMKKIKEQDLQSQLMDEEHNLKAIVEIQVHKYLMKMKQIYIQQKESEQITESSEQIKKLNEQLKLYQIQIKKQQEIQFKEIELKKQQELMSNQFQYKSQIDQHSTSDSVKVLSNLKQEFVKLSYNKHTKISLLFDAESQLRQLQLEDKLGSFKTIVERKSYLKSVFKDLKLEIEGQKSNRKIKRSQKNINSNFKSQKLNQSFDVTHQKVSLIDFIENEKRRVKDYLIELKNEKLQAKEIYNKLNDPKEGQNQNMFDEQSNHYNSRVDLIRKMQEKILKLEDYLKKITHLLQEYLQFPSQENKNQTEKLRDKYREIQDDLEEILFKIKKEFPKENQILESNLEISNELRQSFNQTFYKYQNYESCTQKTKLLLEQQHCWLNSVKQQLNGIQIQRHLRSQSFY